MCLVDSQTDSLGIFTHHVLRTIGRYAVSTRWEREVAEKGPRRDFHSFFCCLARRMGNMFVLCERYDGSPVIIAGPCWPFCFLVTVPLILGIPAAVAYFYIINEDSPVVREADSRKFQISLDVIR